MSSTTKRHRKHRFFYHYNKPNKCLTVHHKGKCLLTDAVDIAVPTESKTNKKQQPHIVMQGWCSYINHTPQITTIS